MAPEWLPLPGEWTYPRLLLGALTLTLVVAVVVAASTSTTAFGVYNPAWDGTADLRDQAAAVDTRTTVALDTTAYRTVNASRTVALVLSPDAAYDRADRARLRRFLDRGGTLVVAEDVGPYGDGILAAVGAVSRFDGRLLRDERAYYRAPDLPLAPNVTAARVTRNVSRLTLNHATVVATNASAPGVTVLVRSSEFSYLDANRNQRLDANETLASRPVVVRERVGAGTVYVVSDASLFINAMLDRPGNRRFVRNLLAIHDRVLLDYSHLGGYPPLAYALFVLRQTPLLQGLLGVVGVALVAQRRRLADVASRDPDDTATRPGRVDADALATYLQRRYPDWEERRVRRVMRGVLARRRDTSDDE